MDLTTYQAAAAETAMPKAYDLDYLVPMIVGEVGELLGQRAKSHWHGWTPERLQAELISEYGDVAWGTAILLKTQDVQHALAPLRHSAYSKTFDPWSALVSRAGYLYQFYSDMVHAPEVREFLTSEARLLWQALEFHCESITGVPFQQVLEANLAKLAGRVERGTLVGSGDHR